MRQKVDRIKRVVPWILVVLLVAVGGYQLAAAKSRTARIHSCVDKRTRLVHIVGPHKSCRHSQYSKSWNIRGLQGPPGQPGPAAAESFRTQDVCVDAKGNLSIADTQAQGDGASATAIAKGGKPKDDGDEGDGKPPKDDKGKGDEGDEGGKPPKDDKGDKGKDACVSVLTVLTPIS